MLDMVTITRRDSNSFDSSKQNQPSIHCRFCPRDLLRNLSYVTPTVASATEKLLQNICMYIHVPFPAILLLPQYTKCRRGKFLVLHARTIDQK
ncbi:hypothetical protein BDDG_11835 [Blastomyces dermatitidis ATCC 18188]|uniref:Uncharacterized protein n=1 Tax=Ajellomyces dermatitidis (strain ATCC 18188 / CBS 674.68) TaxID=653446 RepID=A0A0J9EP10_AJEDA|nr:hypothetical protein BDDG_11835 [Blastomyces dermatitidis ATCC 18188]